MFWGEGRCRQVCRLFLPCKRLLCINWKHWKLVWEIQNRWAFGTPTFLVSCLRVYHSGNVHPPQVLKLTVSPSCFQHTPVSHTPSVILQSPTTVCFFSGVQVQACVPKVCWNKFWQSKSLSHRPPSDQSSQVHLPYTLPSPNICRFFPDFFRKYNHQTWNSLSSTDRIPWRLHWSNDHFSQKCQKMCEAFIAANCSLKESLLMRKSSVSPEQYSKKVFGKKALQLAPVFNIKI